MDWFHDQIIKLASSGITLVDVDFEEKLNDPNNTDATALFQFRANGPVQGSEPFLKTVGLRFMQRFHSNDSTPLLTGT